MKQRINQIYETKKSKYTDKQLECLSIEKKQSLFTQLFKEAVIETMLERCTMQ